MFTIREDKEYAEKNFKRCDRCCTQCPESNCLWAAVLANGGDGKIWCTRPNMDEQARITRVGM